MKVKLVVLVLVASIILVVPPKILGFSIWHIGSALDIAASMGAKLSCSGKFITGLTDHQIKRDLISYSPANELLEVNYDFSNKKVTASMLGVSTYSATYREGLGCALDIGDTQHLDEVSTKSITLSNQPWPAGSAVNTIKPKKQAFLNNVLIQDNENNLQTRALLWVENGEIVAESYADGFDKNSKLLGWSMGKSLTAIMLGRMEYLGLANLQQNHLFPEWEKDERANISLEHLLQMSSGLAFDETYSPGSDSTKMLFLSHSASNVALKAKYAFPPTQQFSYSSGTTNIISRWIYERLGSNAQASYNFLHDELFQKLGMSQSIFETDSSGVFVGSSYIYASARDWARLGLLMLNDGEINGQQLLTKEWTHKAATPNLTANYSAYGYQFWLNKNGTSLEYPLLPQDAYFMLGNRKQVVMIVPSQNSMIIRLGWTSGDYPMNRNFSNVLNYATKGSN